MGASPKHEGEARAPQTCHYMLWGRTQGCLGMEQQHQGGPAQDRASQYHQEEIPARVQANPMTGRVGGEKHVCIQNRCTCPCDSRFEALSQNAKQCNVVSRKFVTSHKCLVTAQQVSSIRLFQGYASTGTRVGVGVLGGRKLNHSLTTV